jgi:hypothetical protein
MSKNHQNSATGTKKERRKKGGKKNTCLRHSEKKKYKTQATASHHGKIQKPKPQSIPKKALKNTLKPSQRTPFPCPLKTLILCGLGYFFLWITGLGIDIFSLFFCKKYSILKT